MLHVMFPPDKANIANFLVHICKKSERPQSLLKCVSAAITHLYASMGLSSPMPNQDISMLCTALIKCKTIKPMKRSLVMPVEYFSRLFVSWKDNHLLSLKQLRIKAITLLSLTAMLRPSDIAPKGVITKGAYEEQENIVFTTDKVIRLAGGRLKLILFGIKNDIKRKGFEIVIQPHSNIKLCPVRALECYLTRTECFRSGDNNAVFISLRRPYLGLKAEAIASDLNEAIRMAGIKEQGFTAKCFRPTGATVAVQSGHNPDIVRKTGHWKNSEVFFEHYVHTEPNVAFTDDIIHQ